MIRIASERRAACALVSPPIISMMPGSTMLLLLPLLFIPAYVATSRPYSLKASADELMSGAFSVLVAEVDGEVAGFASLSQYRERAAYRSTVEDSIYVQAGHRGLGIADRLLGALLDVTRTSGFHSVIARIGGGNTAVASSTPKTSTTKKA